MTGGISAVRQPLPLDICLVLLACKRGSLPPSTPATFPRVHLISWVMTLPCLMTSPPPTLHHWLQSSAAPRGGGGERGGEGVWMGVVFC